MLLARDVLEGTASAATGGVVVTTTLLYALGSVALAARIFGTEAVLSSESSGWGDLLRRANQTQSSAAPASALLCLAMLFPAYFLANASLARRSGPRADGQTLAARVSGVGLTAAGLTAAVPFGLAFDAA